MPGNVREFFFKVRELSGNLVICSEKAKKMSGNVREFYILA